MTTLSTHEKQTPFLCPVRRELKFQPTSPLPALGILRCGGNFSLTSETNGMPQGDVSTNLS